MRRLAALQDFITSTGALQDCRKAITDCRQVITGLNKVIIHFSKSTSHGAAASTANPNPA
jgi:hypothetical protein